MLVLAVLAVFPLALTACGDGEEEPAELPSLEAFRDVPVFRPAATIAWQTGDGAVELIYHARAEPDIVAAFFRHRLAADGWTILGDVMIPDSTISLHAQRDGTPVWVLVKRQPGGQGTEFRLIGVEPDTTETTP
jgi:hypothetical protein